MKTIRTLVLWWVAASIFLVSAVNAQSNPSAAAPPPFKARSRQPRKGSRGRTS